MASRKQRSNKTLEGRFSEISRKLEDIPAKPVIPDISAIESRLQEAHDKISSPAYLAEVLEGVDLGGGSGGTGGSGSNGYPTAGVPTNMYVVSNVGYRGPSNEGKVRVKLAWDAAFAPGDLPEDPDIPADQYEVWARTETSEISLAASVTGTQATIESWSPTVPVYARVRARYGAGRWSNFSFEVFIIPESPAAVVPKAPTSFTISSNSGFYTQDGIARARVTYTWLPVTQSTSNDPVVVTAYQIWERIGTSPWVQTTQVEDPTAVMDYSAGEAREVRVRAVSLLGAVSAYSSTLSVTPGTPAASTPKAPTGGSVSDNTGFFDSRGEPFSQFTLSWNAVTLGIDNQPVPIREYEIGILEATGVSGAYIERTVGRTIGTSIRVNTITGSPSGFVIRAVSQSGVRSGPSTTVTVTGATPIQNTTPPSAPTLVSVLGQVRPTWDGLLTSGSPPSEFFRLIVQYSLTADNASWNTIGVPLTQAGSGPSISGTVGNSVWVRFLWIDTLNRTSLPSTVSSIAVVGVAAAEIDAAITDAIHEAQENASDSLDIAQAAKDASILASADAVTATTAANAAILAANGKNTVYYQTAQPTGGTYLKGDLWFDSDNDYKLYTYTGTAWVLSQDAKGASDAAITAKSVADAALLDAQTAANTATEALTAANGAVVSLITEYALAASETVAPTTGWSATAPTRTPGSFIWSRTKTTYGDDSVVTSSAALLTGNAGAAGPTGSAAVTINVGNDAVALPTNSAGSTLSASAIVIPFSAYLGSTRIAATIAASGLPSGITAGTNTAATVSSDGYLTLNVANGSTLGGAANGEITLTVTANGLTFTRKYSWAKAVSGSSGTPGVGIASTTITYQASASGTVVPTGTWVAGPPAVTPGQFLWTRTVHTYTDTTTATGYSVAAQGLNGTVGSNGSDGVGVSSAVVSYQIAASGTVAPTGTWTASPVATAPGQFLWTRTVTTYTNASSTTAYAVAAHGANGLAGLDGTSATTIDIGNEAVTIPTTPAGATVSVSTITIPFSGWVGASRAATTIAVSGLPTGITVATNTPGTASAAGSLVLTVANGATLGGTALGDITLTVTCNSIAFVRVFTWAKAPAGVSGAAGLDGVSATTIDVGNDAVALPTNAAGATLTATTITIPFAGRLGANRIAATIAATGLPAGITVGTNTPATTTADGSLTLSVASGSTLGGTSSGEITLTITANSLPFVRKYSWAKAVSGTTGSNGTNGVGVSSVAVTYQASTSGTVVPTGTWLTSPPVVPAGQFLWTRNLTTYTDTTTSNSYSVAAQGVNGADGNNGIGVTSTAVDYQIASSGTVAPTGTWTLSPTATAPGQFLWSRTITTYLDTRMNTTTYSISAHGATGTAGTSATTIDIGNEAVTLPTDAAGATTSASTVTIPFSGWVGAARAAVSVAVTGLPAGITVGTNTAGTASAAGSLVLNVASASTLGGTATGNITLTVTCNGITFVRTFTWAKAVAGAAGGAGATGKGVSSIKPYFLLVTTGSATPAAPTANPPGGAWSLTEPAYVSNTELYRADLYVFTDATFGWTSVTKVSSYTAATAAVTVANLAQASANGKVKASQTDPGQDPGRIWLQLDADGKTTGIKISNGTAWSSYTLMADSILVPGSTSTISLKDGAVTADKMKAGTITAISGIIDDAAITTAKIADAAITDAKINTLDAGKITTGFLSSGIIKAGTISGDKLTANSITGDKIVSDTISTSKMMVNNYSNLVEDPGFDMISTTPSAWKLHANASRDTYLTRSGLYALKLPTAASAYDGAQGVNPVAVSPGETYVIGAWVAKTTGSATTSGVSLRFLYGKDKFSADTATADLAVGGLPAAATNYVFFSGTWTVPATYTWARPSIVVRDTTAGNIYYVDDVFVSRQTDGITLANGVVSASKIQAKTITSDKLIVADLNNSMENANFDDSTTNGWTITGDATGWTTTAWTSGRYLTRDNATARSPGTYTNNFRLPVVPGAQVKVLGAEWCTGPVNATLGVQWYTSTGALLSVSSDSLDAASTAWKDFSYIATAPATAAFASVRVSDQGIVGSKLQVRSLWLAAMNAGQLIVDGSIQGRYIASKTIVADNIAAGAITVDKIDATVGNALDISSNQSINLIVNTTIPAVQSALADTTATANAAATAGSVSALDGKIAGVAKSADDTQDSVAALQTWFRVDGLGAHVGQTGSKFQTHIKPDQFEITESNVVTTWWEGQKMVVPKLESGEADIGSHKFTKFGTGVNSGTVITRLTN